MANATTTIIVEAGLLEGVDITVIFAAVVLAAVILGDLESLIELPGSLLSVLLLRFQELS